MTTKPVSDDADRYESLLDPVTHLPGLVLLHDRLEMALAHARRVRRSVAILAIDVRGLAAAAPDWDQTIAWITDRLRESVRADDTVARTGDHEFVVVCNDILDPEDLGFIARCLEQALVPQHREVERSELSEPAAQRPVVVTGLLARAESTATALLDSLPAVGAGRSPSPFRAAG